MKADIKCTAHMTAAE